jgi:hypothetical protein
MRFGLHAVFGLLLARITEAPMKKQEELIVIAKTYDLILRSRNHTGRFPRQHRFVLSYSIAKYSRAASISDRAM